MNTLLMAEDVSAGWDGWDIDADCMMKLQPAARLTKQTVTADGPQEFRLHNRYELGTATILEQDMIFRAESTLVEWQTALERKAPCAESGIPHQSARQNSPTRDPVWLH